MPPIHDTDLAEERWSQAEWGNYELWEKQELRLKRRNRIWIISTSIMFLVLSSIPILIDRWPKWYALSVARAVAEEINQIKKEAIINRAAYRLTFTESIGLAYSIEKVENCQAEKGDKIRTGHFVTEANREKYAWLTPAEGAELNIPGLVKEVCYDDLSGNSAFAHGEEVVGIGVIPANDLTEKRLDRVSVLLLTGPSAEISFN